MIPAAFEYERPATLDAAVAALATSGGSAKVIAGGQSLLPLMKLRLAHADRLIDIGRIAELKGSRPTADGGFEMGALTTYAEALASTQLDFSRECLEGIGDVQVRNRGTIAGAIAHADPASDAPADGFFQGPFQTAMESDEIIVWLRRGPLPAGATGAYLRMEQPASGYSMVGVAVVVARSGGAVSHARVALTGVGEHPYRAKGVESALLGSDGSSSAVAAAAAHAIDGVTVNNDIHADRAYRSEMAVVYTRRAIETALGRSA